MYAVWQPAWERYLKGGIFQPTGSTPKPYKDFPLQEAKLWLVKPPELWNQRESRLPNGGEGSEEVSE